MKITKWGKLYLAKDGSIGLTEFVVKELEYDVREFPARVIEKINELLEKENERN